MFHNYFFLKRLAEVLNTRLKGGIITSCFSQQKDELIIGIILKDKEDFFIKASLDNEINLLSFPATFHRAKKNSIDLFPQIIDTTVESVKVVEFDRSFYFKLDNNKYLLFKLHGNRSNIILIGERNILFKNKLKNDEEISIESISKPLNLKDLSEDSLQKLENVCGKEIREYLETHKNYRNLDIKEKKTAILTLLQEIELNPISIFTTKKPTLSILHKPSNQSFDDPIEAVNTLFRETVGTYLLVKEKHKIYQAIQGRIRQSENYIKKSEKKLYEIESRRKYEEIANILMANLHQVPANKKSIELYDFYTEQPITIKLNPHLTPQKNAENYYKKGKNESIEKEKLLENISGKKNLISMLLHEQEKIERVNSLRELRDLTSKSESVNKKENLPYRSFLYKGYEIRVGKNAAANDRLTLKYSTKNDLWLHAKDVAGSHTIIKKDHPHSVPSEVVEYAAGIAAHYSKRKTETLCPVIVTERKYVRKGKGLPPGKVIVEKEEVILVEPRSPSEH